MGKTHNSSMTLLPKRYSSLDINGREAHRISLYLWCWSTFEKFFGGAQRVAEYADLAWEGNKEDGNVRICNSGALGGLG